MATGSESQAAAAEQPGAAEQSRQGRFPGGPSSLWDTKMPHINGALNEYSVERVGEDVKENLVMLHGYGAGLGFWYKNYEPLTRIPGWKLYSLDMLGMGNSIRATDPKEKIVEAEAWFIDALEEWRIERKIEKFTLLGHSLGGYLAVSYALKYPGHLKKLILASPAGFPENPYAVNDKLPEPDESTMPSEFIEDQETTTQGHGADKAAKRLSTASQSSQPNVPIRKLPHGLYGSGTQISLPSASVGRQTISQTETETLRETGIPVIMLYGENDWMDVAGGLAAEQKLIEAKRKALIHNTEEEKKKENGRASVVVITKAGHHLYLDNPEEFNDFMRKEMEETMAAS
ncbi:unnamed protein product [Parascedosporium putredinis]|uniref:AB hydrolase-1 domain-containing protein n=1 Tax=Parascedosporium putredinis TaxID=1442378 RepID=A0A9P1H2M6_9PEZI|nr:unnamed protein product [Parascedosporium putredinis]CAI7995050.1 unnamed protein product [Parascedosporium putredinis]